MRSNAPYAPARISVGYLRDPADLAMLRNAVRQTLKILDHPAFDELRGDKLPQVPPPDPDANDQAIDNFIRFAATSLFHPAGTCKMGVDGDPNGVLDAELRVRGVGRLRVADASVIPSMPSGNVHTPTTMIGERAAAFLAQSWTELAARTVTCMTSG